jgi:hypothetical protein
LHSEWQFECHHQLGPHTDPPPARQIKLQETLCQYQTASQHYIPATKIEFNSAHMGLSYLTHGP